MRLILAENCVNGFSSADHGSHRQQEAQNGQAYQLPPRSPEKTRLTAVRDGRSPNADPAEDIVPHVTQAGAHGGVAACFQRFGCQSCGRRESF